MSNLSVTIIARDAEHTIKKMLDSIVPLAPQIIVVDTGSVDNTVEIARSYTNFVYNMTWNDDFSKARNETLKYIANEWIMYIDTDEWLDESAPGRILPIVNSTPKEIGWFHSFELHQGPVRLPQVRLWHKSAGSKWIRPVHEHLSGAEPDNVVCHNDIIVHHAQKPTLSSVDRNIKILERHLADTNDPLDRFYLALEYNMQGEYIKSIQHAMRFLVEDKSLLLGRRMYVKYVLAWTYAWKIVDYNASVKHCIEALSANCCIPEFWCILGDVFFRTNQPSKAMVFYENAIFFGQYHPGGMWIRDLEKSETYPRKRILQCQRMIESGISRVTHPEYYEPIIPIKH